MARKLVDGPRAKAIVNFAWETIKTRTGLAPSWNYIATVAIVDQFIESLDDGRDVGDALVLCWESGEPVTKANLRRNMRGVDKARQGTAGYT